MKVTSSSGIYKTIYHNGIYLLLFGKKNNKVLVFHVNKSSYFKISASLFNVTLQ